MFSFVGTRQDRNAFAAWLSVSTEEPKYVYTRHCDTEKFTKKDCTHWHFEISILQAKLILVSNTRSLNK